MLSRNIWKFLVFTAWMSLDWDQIANIPELIAIEIN